jgi:hypothetical protein
VRYERGRLYVNRDEYLELRRHVDSQTEPITAPALPWVAVTVNRDRVAELVPGLDDAELEAMVRDLGTAHLFGGLEVVVEP